MTVQELFREDVIHIVRVSKYTTNDCVAVYEPEDYFNNIVANIYGNGYKIRAITTVYHSVIFYVEEIDHE